MRLLRSFVNCSGCLVKLMKVKKNATWSMTGEKMQKRWQKERRKKRERNQNGKKGYRDRETFAWSIVMKRKGARKRNT